MKDLADIGHGNKVSLALIQKIREEEEWQWYEHEYSKERTKDERTETEFKLDGR